MSLARGAVPEVVVDGVTGFVRQGAGELAGVLDMLDQIDPQACRYHVEQNFGPDEMVTRYEQVYRECLAGDTGRDLNARQVVPQLNGQTRPAVRHGAQV